MKQDTKKESPAADATRQENTIPVSDGGSQKSRKITVPPEIIRIQQERIAKAAQDPQAEKLLADVMEALLVEILKNSLASVTDALKSYANALHKDRHHPLPFVMCQSDECVCGRTMIDGAIKVIARAEEIATHGKPQEDANEEEPEHEGDPDDYHDGLDVCADCDKPITPYGDNRCRCIGKAEVDDVS